jgi:hypothetical protein
MADEKKIIIDEDWKEQAQKEKEKLAEQEQTEDKKHGRGPLPKGDIGALISMLTTQILFALGFLQMEGQEPREPDLELAKFNIDLLETLEEKTKGNISDEEAKVLKSTLNEVRMAYVKMAG